MSWLNNLSDLAGKAESLLNNIDQSAAEAISKSKDQPNENQPIQNNPVPTPGQKIATAPLVDSTPPKRPLAATKLREVERVKQPTTSDDALFDFLNSDQKIKRTKSTTNVQLPKRPTPANGGNLSSQNTPTKGKLEVKDVEATVVPSSLEISRSSSFDSNHSKLSRRDHVDNGSSSSEPQEVISETDVITLPTDSTNSESEFEMVGSTAAASLASDRDSPSSAEAVLPSISSSRDLAVENRLLKNEMSSLHQELTQTNQRYKKIKSELQLSNNELRSRCDDMSEELKVKSSQLSALHMKLRESDNLLIMEQENSGKLQIDVDMLRRDQSDGSDMHIRALDELRARLEETEHQLTQERKTHSDTRQELFLANNRQESETKKIVESYQKSERDRQLDKKNLDEMKSENRTLKTNLTQTKQELNDYKQKATRILQSKERLISSLKGSGETEMTSSTIASLEMEDLRQERDTAREHVASLQIELQNLRLDYQDQEQQYQQENSTLAQELNDLRCQADEESRARHELQSELARIQEDIRQDREEASRSRNASQARLKDKDLEIERLRNQLMIKSQSSPQANELESRLRQLTETVIQKQAVVETLSSEKNSLLVQMERMEGQIKRLSQEGGNHVRVNMDGDNSRRHQNTSHIPEYSYGGSTYGVVGKVRKAASILDRISIKLGVFLKRYPPARIFLLFYMGLLHVWVMIVLLTYKPEAHGQDFVGPRRTDLMVGC